MIATGKGFKENILINCHLLKNKINIIKYQLLIKWVEVFLNAGIYAKNTAKMFSSGWVNIFNKKEREKLKEFAKEHKNREDLRQLLILGLGLLQINLKLKDHLILVSFKLRLVNIIKKQKTLKTKEIKNELLVDQNHYQKKQ